MSPQKRKRKKITRPTLHPLNIIYIREVSPLLSVGGAYAASRLAFHSLRIAESIKLLNISFPSYFKVFIKNYVSNEHTIKQKRKIKLFKKLSVKPPDRNYGQHGTIVLPFHVSKA